MTAVVHVLAGDRAHVEALIARQMPGQGLCGTWWVPTAADPGAPVCGVCVQSLVAMVDQAGVVARELVRAQASTEAWFGAWECGCSDTETSPLGIPEFCPVHGRKLLSNFAGQTKVQLNHSGVSGYGFRPSPEKP